VLIAQRPGFTAPTLLAQQLAAIDQFSRGRVALHVITGGNATELRQDGNTIDDKDERYARTSEFLDVVRAEWSSTKPFTYSGKYYQVENGFSQVKPYRSEGIRIYFGGASDAAIEVISDKRLALEDFVRRLAMARAWSLGNITSYAETWGKLMNIPSEVPLNWLVRARISIVPIDEGVIADEQKTIDLYFRSGLIRRQLDASDIVDRSFSDAIAKGAGL
jgi:alkanesulfonate monooxygenase SsuD/methylene tetrahydromethanopterin reductase-like flavin-dependent oxidoreductase (luciferase family)